MSRRRRRWDRRAVLLALALGVGAGGSLGALLGAQRATTSLDRFVDYYQPENAQLFATAPAPDGPVLDLMRRMNAVPGVTGRIMAGYIIGFTPPGTPGTPAIKGTVAQADVSFTRRVPVAQDRLLAGREPDPGRADEAVINEAGAAVTGVHVGSQLPLRMFSPADAAKISNGFSAAPSMGTSVTITGIVRNPVDLTRPVVAQPGTVFAGNVTRLELTAAFYQAYGAFIAGHGVTDLVRIRTGAARSAIVRLMAADSATSGAHMVIQDGAASFPNRRAAQRAVNTEAMDLLLPGALLALVTILLLGSALAVHAGLDDDVARTLATVGMSRRGLVRAELAEALPLIAAASVIAAGVAVALSPVLLFGVSRLAELHPGFAVRPALLFGGVAAFALALALFVAAAGWYRYRPGGMPSRSRTSAAGRARPWLSARVFGLTETVAGWGAGPAAPAGVSLAFAPGRPAVTCPGGGGRARLVPVRLAVTMLAVAVTAATAALTYATSRDHFTSVARLRGWDWDVAIGNISTPADADAAMKILTTDHQVGTFSGVGIADVRIDGQSQPLLWLTTDHGVVGPTVLTGRLPVVPGEVALATGTMRRAHAALGGTVRVGTGIRETSLRVVGVVLGPAVLADGIRLDTGVVLTHEAAALLGGSVYQEPTSYLVRFRAGTKRTAELARLKRSFPGAVVGPTMPGDVTNVDRLTALPPLLAGLLAVLGLGVLLFALLATVRRRDQLAALRALGFSRRQLRDTVLWQAGALAAAASVVGLPVGALAGRTIWLLTANVIGVPAPAIVPWTIVLAAAGALAAAATTALWPGRLAAHC